MLDKKERKGRKAYVKQKGGKGYPDALSWKRC